MKQNLITNQILPINLKKIIGILCKTAYEMRKKKMFKY